MNTIKLNNLTTDVAVYEQNGKLYFDLVDLVGRMGYSQPKKALSDFIRRKCPSLESDSIWYDNKMLVPEWCLFRFLARNGAPRAKEFQKLYCCEILPAITKRGMDAIKKLEAIELVNANKQSPELLPVLKGMLGEEAEQFCRDNGYYRILGYLPPHKAKPKDLSPTQFWRYINLEKSDCFYCAKYHNPYREDGRWYAFKTTVYHEIPEEPKDHGCPSDMDDDMPEFIPSYGSAWDL